MGNSFYNKLMHGNRLKTILIISWAVALALVVVTVLVVFYPNGGYMPVTVQNNGATFSNLPSSTASSFALASSTASSTPTSTAGTPSPNSAAEFASDYSAPYPVTWKEGNEQFSLIGASLTGNQLTLTLAIQMGMTPDCVPVNMRIIADESGTLMPPSSPAGTTFIFPDTQTCNGTPGATYSEPVTFTTDNIQAPYLMTTGGASNIFFNVATNTARGIDVALPGTSG